MKGVCSRFSSLSMVIFFDDLELMTREKFFLNPCIVDSGNWSARFVFSETFARSRCVVLKRVEYR